MKKTLHIFSFLAIACLLSWSTGLTAQTYERTRTVSRIFGISPGKEVQVSNKYGNLHLVTWEQDSAKFDISLTVTSNKESRLEKNFDYVDFEFKDTEYYVIAQTVFRGQTDIWAEISDLANSLFSSGTNTRIDYTIYLPDYAEIKLENKFGNIYTTDHKGRVDISLSNGDLKAHAFRADTKIRLEFGNATIDEMSRGSIFSNYGEITLEKAGYLDIESKSSKFFLRQAAELLLNSRRDKFNIRSVQSISGEINFTFVEVDKAYDHIDLRTNYGGVDIREMADEFNYCTLNSNYTDLNIYLGDDMLYELDITYNDKTELLLPSNMLSKTETVINESDKIRQVEGKAGKIGGNSIPVNIRTMAGNIFFIHQ